MRIDKCWSFRRRKKNNYITKLPFSWLYTSLIFRVITLKKIKIEIPPFDVSDEEFAKLQFPFHRWTTSIWKFRKICPARRNCFSFCTVSLIKKRRKIKTWIRAHIFPLWTTLLFLCLFITAQEFLIHIGWSRLKKSSQFRHKQWVNLKTRIITYLF